MGFFESFREFFVGNPHAYARLSENGWYAVKEDLDDVVLGKHLRNKITIGSYCGWCVDGVEYCKWICIDFDQHLDEYEGKAIPSEVLEPSKRKMFDLVRNLEINEGIELNNLCYDYSGGGYHLWIKLAPMTLLKRAFDFSKYLENEYELEDEIFPKQRKLGSLGNLVKLPMSLHRKRDNVFCECYIFVNSQGKLFGVDFRNAYHNIGNGYEIRDSIPKYKAKISKKYIKEGKKIIIPKRDECFNWFLEHMKPCIKRIALDNSLTHGIGDGIGHAMNMTLADTFIYLGASNEIIHEAFKTHTNYDYHKTEQMIKGVRSNFHPNHARISCKKIEERGFCIRCWEK